MTQAVTNEAIRTAVQTGQWAYTVHAQRGAGDRRIAKTELAQALLSGAIIEDYPEDQRGHSALVLGQTAGRWLHAVCTFDPSGALLIITVYEPALPKWRDERTRNR